MPEATGLDPGRSSIRRLRDAPRNGAVKTLVVSLLICFACSVLVSGVSLLVRPYRLAHERQAQRERIVELLARNPGIAELLGSIDQVAVETQLVDLATGAFVAGDALNFDERRAAQDPATSVAIPAERDLARIHRRSTTAPVYLVRRDGKIEAVVLPIHGRGYASIIRGYVALGADGNTILGISFHEHGETPGVGSEITGEDWRILWEGKKVRDPSGAVRIRVLYEDGPPVDLDPVHRIDGMTGVSRSCDGVSNMIRYWLGDDGFGPFLRRLSS